MDISAILFALTMLHAGYLIQLCFRQPSQKEVSNRSESRFMWFVASPSNTLNGRIIAFCLCMHHALISLLLSPGMPKVGGLSLESICPRTNRLDPQLFTWSSKTVGPLVLLYAACYVRLEAYAQLGTNFTYRLAVPDRLVTNGLYAYVRNPSYTGLFGVVISFKLVFLNQHGGPSCTGLSFGEGWIAQTAPTIGFLAIIWLIMMGRVKEEEKMLAEEFGEEWTEYCKRTTRFIPFLV